MSHPEMDLFDEAEELYSKGELNKPCIIGTKVATQVLKDGMKVEVDADNGIIRIIK